MGSSISKARRGAYLVIGAAAGALVGAWIGALAGLELEEVLRVGG